MLASFLGVEVISLRYLLDGAEGSVLFILSKRRDSVHSFWACLHSFALWACIRAVLLYGKFVLSKVGSLSSGELPSVMAFFASSSAFSFPVTFLCPGTQMTLMVTFLCFFFSVSRESCIASKM